MTLTTRSGTGRIFGVLLAVGLLVVAFDRPGFADEPERTRPVSGDAAPVDEPSDGLTPSAIRDMALAGVRGVLLRVRAWYTRTPPPERVTWGGLVACGGLGLYVLIERTIRLRQRRIVPPEFTARFVDHLHDGVLDGGQALDHCERNPSPAARVALAAVRRWGRPAGDLERAVAMAHRVEAEGLRRNVGTLRRVAALSALLGILGTLFALGRALESIPTTAGAASQAAWGPALAAAITPLSTGLIIATLALVAYDGVQSRVEQLAAALDRLGAETIEAIAMSAPPPTAPVPMSRPNRRRTA